MAPETPNPSWVDLTFLGGLGEIGLNLMTLETADYLVVEAEREYSNVPVGTMLDMIPAYEALVAAWTSPYVELKLL